MASEIFVKTIDLPRMLSIWDSNSVQYCIQKQKHVFLKLLHFLFTALGFIVILHFLNQTFLLVHFSNAFPNA